MTLHSITHPHSGPLSVGAPGPPFGPQEPGVTSVTTMIPPAASRDLVL